MPKVKIIRKGARRPVQVSAQLASHLTKTRNWSYAEEIPDAKRAPKKHDAPRSNAASQSAAPITKAEESAQAPEQKAVAALSSLPKGLTMSAAKPMKASFVRPTRVPHSSREQLEEMNKADLKVLGQKIGLDLKSSESKAEWVNKLNRYMRRDMRAER